MGTIFDKKSKIKTNANMKNIYLKSAFSHILFFAFMLVMISACTTTNRIFTENDIVYSTKRSELKYYVREKDRRSPLFSLSQTLIKETNSANETTYKAYDVLYLTSSAFKLDNKVFFIIDNEAYPMALDRVELENTRNVSENTSSVSTSDSTSVSVVTGYSENNEKITRFNYKIPPEIIEKIKGAGKFQIRYYSGPNMITVKPKQLSIIRIKQLAGME